MKYEVVVLHDVRMRLARRELGLGEEHVDERRHLGQVRPDALDDDVLLEALDAIAAGEEHLGHAADPDLLEQGIAAKALSHGRDRGQRGSLPYMG